VLKRRASNQAHPGHGEISRHPCEPISFGLKFALWLLRLAENLKRMEDAARRFLRKISGAVGTFANIPSKSRICRQNARAQAGA
jgi:adenylosuccinate lyase